MNFKEERMITKYEYKCMIIEKFANKEIRRYEAARYLRLSHKQVTRLKKKFLEGGIQGLVHKSKGKKKPKLFSGELEQTIVGYYSGIFAEEQNNPKLDYSGYNFHHFYTELIYGDLKYLNIKISYSTLYKGLTSLGFITTGRKRNKETQNCDGCNIDAIYNFGERVEIDACEWDWFGEGKKRKAHVAYCRGYRAPLAIWFDDEETTLGYLNLMAIVYAKYGVPVKIIADRRGTFVNLKKQDTPKEYATMFNKSVLFEYGVDYFFTSNPDGKPGVESCNNYIESQLPIEFARRGINNIDSANEYMNEYCEKRIEIAKHKYKDEMFKKQNSFSKPITVEKIRSTFILKEQEVGVDKHGFVPYKGVQYVPIRNGYSVKYNPKTRILVQVNYTGDIFQKLDHSIIELVVAQRKSEHNFKTKDITRFTKRISDKSTVTYKKIEYVIVANNGYHLELQQGETIEIEDCEGIVVAFYNKKCYKLVPVKSYDHLDLVLPKRQCKSKFDSTIGYNSDRYVIVNEKRLPVLMEASTIVDVQMHERKLICKVKDNTYQLVKLDEYEYKSKLACSNYVHKKMLESIRSNQQIFDQYDGTLLEV